MDLTYFKRYRMEIDLAGRDFTPRVPPAAIAFCPGTRRFWRPLPRQST